MRFNGLDLNLLVALDAMLSERSISRAAERLHLSQSAMSGALARLRDYFQDELLVQVGRRLDLTPRAEDLRDVVRDLLVQIDAKVAEQPLFEPGRSQRLFRLLVSDFTTMTLMPHVLELAAAEAPAVRFELLPQIDQPDRLLDRGEVDFLVIPEGFCSPGHPSETLFVEDYCCVVWQDNDQVTTDGLTLAQFEAMGHVVVQTGRAQASFEGAFMQREGIARRIEVSTFSFVAPPALVVGTRRLATVHARLARLAAQHMPIRILPVPVRIPSLVEAIQWHKVRTHDSGLAWLRALMHRAAARLDAPARHAEPGV